MAAPGGNLEFQASTHVRTRSSKVPELLENIVYRIQNEPGMGIEICPGIRELEMTFAGKTYVIFTARRSNRISLMYVFLAHETELVEEQRLRLNGIYGKGGFR